MPAPSATPLATLVARNIHHERGGRVVLDDVSLTVSAGTCLGVVGPNGVGKSTLLQILAGLIDPTAGEVRVDPPAATVGYLAQEHARGGRTRPCGRALERRAGVAAAEAGLVGCRGRPGRGRTRCRRPLRSSARPASSRCPPATSSPA